MHSSPPGTEQPRPYAPPLKPACAECVHRAPWEVRRAPQDSSLASTVCPCGVPPRPQGCPASRSAPLVPPADAQAFDHTNVPHAPAPNHRTTQHSALIRTRASHPTASPLHPLPPATPTHDVCPAEFAHTLPLTPHTPDQHMELPPQVTQALEALYANDVGVIQLGAAGAVQLGAATARLLLPGSFNPVHSVGVVIDTRREREHRLHCAHPRVLLRSVSDTKP